jgi:hypothetical protein
LRHNPVVGDWTEAGLEDRHGESSDREQVSDAKMEVRLGGKEP